jgi:hypothetical protein
MNNNNNNSDNGVLGLEYLEKYTEPILNPNQLLDFEWRRQLISTAGNRTFRIKYYGDLHTTCDNLLVATDFAPQKIVAIDTESSEVILLFDACKHGYNAMLCDKYTTTQIESRAADKIYQDKFGNEIFEIVISAYYQIAYEDEFREEVDLEGNIELINGERIDFETLKRNACDFLGILGINKEGVLTEILSEELS